MCFRVSTVHAHPKKYLALRAPLPAWSVPVSQIILSPEHFCGFSTFYEPSSVKPAKLASRSKCMIYVGRRWQIKKTWHWFGQITKKGMISYNALNFLIVKFRPWTLADELNDASLPFECGKQKMPLKYKIVSATLLSLPWLPRAARWLTILSRIKRLLFDICIQSELPHDQIITNIEDLTFLVSFSSHCVPVAHVLVSCTRGATEANVHNFFSHGNRKCSPAATFSRNRPISSWLQGSRK